MRTLVDVFQQVPTSADKGLSPDAVARSRQQFGVNHLTPLPRDPLWKKFLEKFDEPIIKILLVAALLSMVVGLFNAGAYIVGGVALGLVVAAVTVGYALRLAQWVPSLLFICAVVIFLIGVFSGHAKELVEGLAVMVAVILATGVAFYSEYKSDREFEILNAQKESLRVKLLRGGDFHTAPLEDVVVGDVVILEMGDEIPADGRLVKATELYVDQSLMTGESEPVRKLARAAEDTADGPEQPGCLYRGTQVVDGIGEMIVCEVGDATYLGQIARNLSAEPEEEEEAAAADTEQKRVKRKLTVSKELTPLQQKLTNLADLISKVGYIAAVAIFLALLVRGVIKGEVRWPAAGATTYTLAGHPASDVRQLLFSPDGKKLASIGWGLKDEDLVGEVKLWNPRTGAEIGKPLQEHKELITCAAFSANGRYLATGDMDATILVWNADSSRREHILASGPLDNRDPNAGHSRTIHDVAFHPNGSGLASASADGTVRLWDLSTGKPVLLYSGHSHEVTSVAFSPDGKSIASAGEDGVIQIWDPASGALQAKREAQRKPIKRLVYSPDGKRLASLHQADGKREIRIWELANENHVTLDQGTDERGLAFRFTADSQQLAIAGGDQVGLFNAQTGDMVQAPAKMTPSKLTAFSGAGEQIAWSSDGKAIQVYTASSDFGGVLLASAGYLLSYFMYMVIIIVVAVPEGLPMSVTVSLALAMQKMTRANSLVRQLVACETIGSATVICSDKTGTLTQNKMQVVRLAWDEAVFDRGKGEWPAPRQQTHGMPAVGLTPIEWIALNAAVNSTANLEEKEGALLPVGNSTEGALLLWLHDSRLDYENFRLQFEPLYQIHFSSERKRMTTVIRHDNRLVALVKGAPEWVLEQSTHYLDASGQPRPLTPAMRDSIHARLSDTAKQAMRTLAFGYVHLPSDQAHDEDSLHAARERLESGLVYCGFVAIRDPLRHDVQDAIAQCRDAGIEVKMITGDNVETARAIGREIGLLDDPKAIVMTSDEFSQLTDEQLKDRMPRLRILARARPLDKFRMVKLLQEQGEVVAVTGDGTNDAPALKKADVGLAMGRAGTEVAKEASKIVLLDDAFSTIVKAVHWGRSLYENIQRFIQFQLTINVSALVIAFLGPFFGVRPPFTILQLLWINVIMDTFAAIALCSEPPRPGLMKQKPKRRDENILTPQMIRTIFTTAGFFVVVMMILLLGLANNWWLRDTGGTPSKTFPDLTYWQVAVFFSIYVFFQVWNEINCRSLTPEVSGFHRLFRNPVFLAIVGTIIVVQIVIVTFGSEVFEVAPLSPLVWLLIAVFTASVLGYAEIVRQIRLAVARETAFARQDELWRPRRRDYDEYVVEPDDRDRDSVQVRQKDEHGRYQRRPTERDY